MTTYRRDPRVEARGRMLAGRLIERKYAARLAEVSQRIGRIVRHMAPDGVISDASTLTFALAQYADALHPWAESVASRMIADVSRNDAKAWEAHGRAIGRALRNEIASAPTGAVMRQSLTAQVEKITSLPREAAARLFKLTTDEITKGTRASEIAKEILQSGEVSASRARALARTAVSSTATALIQARAEHIGSTGYVWRTSKDGAVRRSHRLMEGKFVPWDAPPTLDGYTAHCGEFANCRCFPEVVIPNKLTGRISSERW